MIGSPHPCACIRVHAPRPRSPQHAHLCLQDSGPGVTPRCPRAAAEKTHVIVLVNGLFGAADNWEVVLEKLQQRLPRATLDSTLILASRASSRAQTYDGIDRCTNGPPVVLIGPRGEPDSTRKR